MEPRTTLSLAQVMAAVRIAKRDAPPDADTWRVTVVSDSGKIEALELTRDTDRLSAMHTGGWTIAYPALVTPD